MKYTIDNPKSIKICNNPEEKNFTGVTKDKDGDISYFVNGQLHREGGPAVIYVNRKGNRNREEGPTIVHEAGAIEYYINGKWHRTNGPARVLVDGSKEYWQNDELHRTDGPAIINANGAVAYYLNNKKLDISTDQELKDYLILRMFK